MKILFYMLLTHESDSAVLRIFFVNGYNGIRELGSNVKRDTYEVFKNAKRIIERIDFGGIRVKMVIMGMLEDPNRDKENCKNNEERLEYFRKTFNDIKEGNFKDNEGAFEYFIRKFNSIMHKEDDLKEKLEYFIKEFNDIRENPMISSNLMILLLSSNNDDVEGASYIGGTAFPGDGYSLVRMDVKDSYFYRGKVLAHEILHTIGGQHDSEEGYLMNEYLDQDGKEVKVSNRTIHEVGRFLKKNIKKFNPPNDRIRDLQILQKFEQINTKE